MQTKIKKKLSVRALKEEVNLHPLLFEVGIDSLKNYYDVLNRDESKIVFVAKPDSTKHRIVYSLDKLTGVEMKITHINSTKHNKEFIKMSNETETFFGINTCKRGLMCERYVNDISTDVSVVYNRGTGISKYSDTGLSFNIEGYSFKLNFDYKRDYHNSDQCEGYFEFFTYDGLDNSYINTREKITEEYGVSLVNKLISLMNEFDKKFKTFVSGRIEIQPLKVDYQL